MTVIEYTPADQGKLLIIGDLLIDRTIYCTVPKISPEAPVPVAMVEPNGIVETPGGAGLAASYAAKNNLDTIFLTAVGENRSKFLEKYNINSSIYLSNKDINPRKTRYIDIDSNHHLLRSDTDNMIDKSYCLSEEFYNKMIDKLLTIIKDNNISGIILLDYCKGIFENELLVKNIINISKEYNIPTYVDSRSNNLSKFTGVNTLKLNLKEFKNTFNNNQDIINLKIENLIITLGKDGSELYSVNEECCDFVTSSLPDIKKFQGTPDVTGCGDVFDVTFCWYWCIKGLSAKETLKKATQEATNFAYKSIKERLTC